MIFRINPAAYFIFSVLVCEMEFYQGVTDKISINSYKTIIRLAYFKKGCLNDFFRCSLNYLS